MPPESAPRRSGVDAASAADSPRQLFWTSRLSVGQSSPPESLGRSLSLSQLASGQYGGEIYKIRYELDVTPERLAIVGLSPIGVTLFTIVHEKGELVVEMLAGNEVKFDPRYTLFDVYLTYWPTEVLRAALSRIRMRLEEAADGSFRRVRESNGEIIAEITYSSKHRKRDEIVIRHYNFPYQLHIETLGARNAR